YPDQFGIEMQIAIEQTVGIDAYATQRFNDGAAIQNQVRATGRLPLPIQCTTDIKSISTWASTEYQRLLPIINKLGTDVQALSCGDDSSTITLFPVINSIGLNA